MILLALFHFVHAATLRMLRTPSCHSGQYRWDARVVGRQTVQDTMVNYGPFRRIGFHCLVVLFTFGLPSYQDALGKEQVQDESRIHSEREAKLRFTRFGWEDAQQWQRQEFTTDGEPLVHPWALSALILLAVVGVMVWASEERDLLRRSSEISNATASMAFRE